MRLRSFAVVIAAAFCYATVAARTSQDGVPAVYEAAMMAWDRGEYPAALAGFIKVLKSPAASDYLDRIALQTGELFETVELTSDGSSPRIGGNGNYVVFEVGQAPTRMSRLVSLADPKNVVELPGVGAVFSPDGDRLAYLKMNAPAIDEAFAAVEKAQGPARTQALLLLALMQASRSDLVVRELATGTETTLVPGSMLMKSSLAFSADGQTVYFVGATDIPAERTDIYAVKAGWQPMRITNTPGHRTTPVVAGQTMLVSLPAASPFRAPAAPGAPGAGRGGGGGGGGGGGAGRGGGAPASFGLIDLAAGAAAVVNTVEGAAPSLSDDGTQVAFIRRSTTENALHVSPVSEISRPAILKTPDRLDAPAFSREAKRIAYQRMVREDWELFTSALDGKDEKRVTREIQHDLLPEFVNEGVLLAVMGEARHRRSYLYDVPTGRRTRLFHNNTVRTIAPEYSWTPSADGGHILIVAERDGNTVTPDRGVYVVDLEKRVTTDAVIARLERSLADEQALRDNGSRLFKPIAAAVRTVLDQASPGRVYGYEKALYDFGSKHITQPGNALAIDYLNQTYKSFGYEAEQQWFEPRGALGGKSANVLATLRGTEDPNLVYVVSSHFDSVAGGPGADDDSSGTAALLEAARIMAKTPMPATIVFASFTGEEAGLLGSREWVRRAQEAKMQVVGALNNDMIGWANDHRLDNTIRYSNPGIRDIQHAAAFLFTRLITYDALYYKGTDANAYYDAWGDIVGGIGSYPVLGNPHYHQSHDLLDGMNHELITETSKTTVATLMLLASSPSRVKDLKITGDQLTWSPSPESGVRSYIVAWGPADQPLKNRLTAKDPRATLKGVAPGMVVSVKAVNARGLEGWDWARVVR